MGLHLDRGETFCVASAPILNSHSMISMPGSRSRLCRSKLLSITYNSIVRPVFGCNARKSMSSWSFFRTVRLPLYSDAHTSAFGSSIPILKTGELSSSTVESVERKLEIDPLNGRAGIWPIGLVGSSLQEWLESKWLTNNQSTTNLNQGASSEKYPSYISIPRGIRAQSIGLLRSLQWIVVWKHVESRWRNSHVLVYHGPLLSHPLGVASSTFTTGYVEGTCRRL